MQTIGEIFKKGRIKKGITQEEISKMIGIDRARYANYERNYRIPDAITFVKICKILKIKISDFKDLGD